MANIETISKSIEKNKEKIAELQKKLRNLEIQKKNAENEEFYKVVKAINLPISEIMVILKAYASGEIELPEEIRELLEEEENDEE